MINPIDNSIMNYNTQTKVQEAQEGDFESALNKAISDNDEKKLKKACNDLEAVFVNMMFKQMRSTVDKSGLMEDDYAEETFEDMLYENYAQEVSKGKGLGLSDILYKQLSKQLVKKNDAETVTGGENAE